MKNDIKLSIIIPYYNTEKYIIPLLDCLDKQMRTDIEVIIVDDGSKVPFTTKYKWAKVIRHLLTEAVEWCRDFGLTFNAINANDPDNIRTYNNDCRKVYAHVYIDDQNASEEFMQKYHIPFRYGDMYKEQLL